MEGGKEGGKEGECVFTFPHPNTKSEYKTSYQNQKLLVLIKSIEK